MRAAGDVRSLRSASTFAAIRGALASATSGAFRVLHFSVQRDHVHLIVEADRPIALARGCQGLAVRLAKAINRALRRHGSVWADRYHARWLRTPREVRNALIYVLQNFRKHGAGGRSIDSRSAAAWFDGWRVLVPRLAGPPPVQPARTWLARVGWLRHGRIDVGELPRLRGVRITKWSTRSPHRPG